MGPWKLVYNFVSMLGWIQIFFEAKVAETMEILKNVSQQQAGSPADQLASLSLRIEYSVMESEISLKQRAGNLDVVVEINTPVTGENGEARSDSIEELSRVQMNLFTSTSDPAAKPPSGAAFRRRSSAKSEYSKPKSRIVEEPPYPSSSNPIGENAQPVPAKTSERNSPNVLYFLFGLKKSFRVVIWLGLILLAWGLLINRGVKRSRKTTKVLNYITRGIASSLIGAVMWILKTLLIKILASSFHVRTFFDRIQESIFHQYILQTLSGSPSMENAIDSSTLSSQLSLKNVKTGKQEKTGEGVINVDKLHKMKQGKVSAWTMGGLIKVIRSSGLTTISEVLDESVEEEDGEKKVITSEVEAKDAANRIFKNVAKHGHKYIDEEDLLLFMPKEEVDNAFPLFEGAVEQRRIKKSSFRKWVVKAYNERKCLAVSLNDAKTAIEELNKIASGIVLVVIIIVWLLLMDIATTKVLVFISSQMLLVVFMFGNTAKMVFEAIVFVFVVHPFDVGDRCVIDGIQMIVEEMNILTTIFLKPDNEKVYYPNAILATKPISNFNRSPEMMGDAVEFAVDFSTSVESIAALRAKIKTYLESKPQQWRPGHSVQIKEIEDVNKMLMALYVTHTINFQNAGERGNRRSDLVFELKRIFEELGIKYRLLPQEVHISYVGSTMPPSI
ncbi:Mechanosensitive ion channel protein 10 [Forsythia ovata]|uniref:Mechanosensitive ion channel protein 10 n=1 Tax=Forsythia ovata TaxID=205694 RepID=A0ABD1SKC2_9LAMI